MKNIKYYILVALPLLLLVAVIADHKVFPKDVDNSVDNTSQNEQPTPTPTVSAEPTATPNTGSDNVRQAIPSNSPTPVDEDADACGGADQDAEAAGWRVLSCDPLRVMALSEWNERVNNPHFRYRPELYCFDESNFAGHFHEQIGEPDSTGYYPDWLSEMKLNNGCSFFFHPTQGRENAPITDGKE